MSFSLFKYTEDRDVKSYMPKLPLPHDACIHKLLDIVKAEQGRCIVEIYSDETIEDDRKRIALHDTFTDTCKHIYRHM